MSALVGGLLIGLAVTLMLALTGRVTGVSGIVNGTFAAPKNDRPWRWSFIGGLLAGGALLSFWRPEFFLNTSGRSLGTLAVAGFLVGFGTVMGGGCTSGHGVCGVSRLSPRSIVATVLFITAGVATVAFWKLVTAGK